MKDVISPPAQIIDKRDRHRGGKEPPELSDLCNLDAVYDLKFSPQSPIRDQHINIGDPPKPVTQEGDMLLDPTEYRRAVIFIDLKDSQHRLADSRSEAREVKTPWRLAQERIVVAATPVKVPVPSENRRKYGISFSIATCLTNIRYATKNCDIV